MKFIALPQRTDQEFELALSSFEPEDRVLLEQHGWRVRESRSGVDRPRHLSALHRPVAW